MTSSDHQSRGRKILLWTVLALILIASVLAGGWLFDHGGKFRNPDPARGSQVVGN
jgi:hypothetical protein